MTTSRVLSGTVAVAAGVSGAALLAFPAGTADFFSWGLGPPPLASLIGGAYLASAVLYACAAVAPWAEARVTTLGILALTIPVFAATLAHLDTFDFGRLQAWLWVVLFTAFPIGAAVALVGEARTSRGPGGLPGARHAAARTHPAERAGAALLAVALAVVSVALWADPAGAGGDLLPFAPSLLGGRVLGSWTFLVAVLAGSIAVSGRRREGRLAALALVAFPFGALAAGLRTFADLEPGGHRAAYLAALLLGLGLGLALHASVRRADRSEPSAGGSPDPPALDVEAPGPWHPSPA
ncbi:MAG: hypothetical protein GEV08_25940 [Acidimicrobiia bacterium]|nr:hypothetical protein [Acidimicrobiia bacterium]